MAKLLRNKKGFSLEVVPQIVIAFVVIAVVLGIGLTVLGSVQETSQCDYNYDPVAGRCIECAGTNVWDSTSYTCLNATGGVTNTSAETNHLSLAWNVTSTGGEAVEDLADWQTTWAVIVAAAVVIGIIGAYLFFRSR